MWTCLYIFHSTKHPFLPYVGLYQNTGDDALQVVRLLFAESAAAFTGVDTAQFTIVGALRPKKVFRTLFLTEGDSKFSLRTLEPNAEKDPDIENLRDQLPDDRD